MGCAVVKPGCGQSGLESWPTAVFMNNWCFESLLLFLMCELDGYDDREDLSSCR